jgi:hypothetical protein
MWPTLASWFRGLMEWVVGLGFVGMVLRDGMKATQSVFLAPSRAISQAHGPRQQRRLAAGGSLHRGPDRGDGGGAVRRRDLVLRGINRPDVVAAGGRQPVFGQLAWASRSVCLCGWRTSFFR